MRSDPLRGLTLLELLVAVSLLSVVLYGAMRAFSAFSNLNAQSQAKDIADEQSRVIGTVLQQALGGSRSFPSLNFKVPPAGPSCQATGFCVVPDQDFQGNRSVGNDVLYVVLRADAASNGQSVAPGAPSPTISAVALVTDFKLGTAVAPGSNGLVLESVNGVTSVSDYLQVGDFLVLNNVTSSEIVQVQLPPTPAAAATGVNLPLPTGSPSSFAATFGGALANNYVKGDYAVKAKILKIGFFQPSGGSPVLYVGSVGSAAPSFQVAGIRSFSAQYDLSNLTASGVSAECLGFQTAPGAYSRDNWFGINRSLCYPALAHVKFSYSLAGSFGTKVNDYVYATN